MLVPDLRPAELSEHRGLPQAAPSAAPKVAVLLNANARKVNARVVRALSHVVPEQDLFLSRSELDARRIVQTVLDRNYATVFTGGGDGTFMGFVNEVYRQLETRREPGLRAPRFGVLKLGTGNAIAHFTNASGVRNDGILHDVLRARADEAPGTRHMDLLNVDGQRAPFAGLGVDGKLLNDYIWVKHNLAKGMLKRVMTGSGGYFSAVTFKTVPHYLTNSTLVECEITNGSGSEAYRLGTDGQPVGEPIAPGGQLFRGKLMMAAAATMPFYGYGLRMFPFADKRRGMMQLRLGQVSPGSVIANLPKLWAGRWFPEGIQDFHASEVTIRYDRPVPFQVAGDAAGYRDEVTFSIAPEAVELVDFHAPVN